MLVIEVKDKNINNALKSYKRKVRDTQLRRELYKRKHFTKPSVTRRVEVMKAEYTLNRLLKD
ncbi:MAG: 30S ribosomal protein S21 [Saprospiraceae bacterium]